MHKIWIIAIAIGIVIWIGLGIIALIAYNRSWRRLETKRRFKEDVEEDEDE